MEWWQGLIGSAPQIGASLGIGTSPFIVAILRGNLRTNKQFVEQKDLMDKRVEDAEKRTVEVEKNAQGRETLLQSELARKNESLENETKAREKERERADAATNKLAELTNEYGGSLLHILQDLRTPPPPGELDG